MGIVYFQIFTNQGTPTWCIGTIYLPWALTQCRSHSRRLVLWPRICWALKFYSSEIGLWLQTPMCLCMLHERYNDHYMESAATLPWELSLLPGGPSTLQFCQREVPKTSFPDKNWQLGHNHCMHPWELSGFTQISCSKVVSSHTFRFKHSTDRSKSSDRWCFTINNSL